MPLLTRGQMTQVRLGCVAALLVPIICKHPEIAYSYALHAKLAETHGEKYSQGDVSRALKLLTAHDVLVVKVEDETKRNGRIFYHPSWIAGYLLATLRPIWDWPIYC